MCVATGCAADQQHPVEGNHEKGAGHDPLERSNMTVPPDVKNARKADPGEDHHQRTQPRPVLVLDGEQHMHSAGDCDHSRAQAGMEDGPS
jgi:hypothetical protein